MIKYFEHLASDFGIKLLCVGDCIVTVNDWLITVMDRPHVSI